MTTTLALSITAMWLVGCAGGHSAKVAPTDAAVHFTAAVTAIEPLGERALQVIVIALPPDPHFALFVQIRSASPPSREFQPEHEVVFAIHSPVRLFRAASGDVVGKQFEFAFSRREGDAHLEVVRQIE